MNTVNINNFNIVMNNLTREIEKKKSENDEALQELSNRMLDIARSQAPVRTGNLRNSIEVNVECGKDKSTIRLKVNEEKSPYAKYVINGTSRIKPNNFLERAAEEAKSFIPK